MTQLRFGEQYCCNCQYYDENGGVGYITNGYTGETIRVEKGNQDGCTLHNTIVLKHSRACRDYKEVIQ